MARPPRPRPATDNYWLRRYYLSEVQQYLRHLVLPGQSVLMFGSYDGELLAQLEPSHGVGLDISSLLVEAARTRYPHLTFQVFGHEPPDVEGTFDIIVLMHVVEFMDDVHTELRKLRRFCHSGTRVIIVTHNYLWAPALVLLERLGLKRVEGSYAWLTLDDIQNLLAFADYEVVSRNYRTVLPVWIPGVSWLTNHVLGQLPGIWKLGIDQWLIARPVGLEQSAESSTVSVVIPCRNERGTIQAVIERTPMMGRQTELVFVEGHSRDGTLEALYEAQQRWKDRDITIVQQEGIGKGDAVRKGIEVSHGDLIVILDADLSVAPEILPRFVEALTSGYCELAVGSRLVYPLPARAMRPLNTLGNMVFGRAFSFLLGQQVKDTLCGTKALWRRDYDRIVRQRAFFGFIDPFGDFDLILGAARLNLRIREIPVRYYERVYGETNIRRWRDGWFLAMMTVRALLKMRAP